MRWGLPFSYLVLLSTLLTACHAGDGEPQTSGDPTANPILLFEGAGTSPEDVAALQQILNSASLQYSPVNSSQMNRMSELQLHEFRLLIVPGGNFEQIGKNLTPKATANIRNAVQNGLNYLGICAGAFFAGNSPYNGLNLTSGVKFGFYAAESRGVRKTAVEITDAEGQRLDHYWEDGPQLSGWGMAVGKYPDGTPAIAEGSFGTGWVILTGIHSEAPAQWRQGMEFKTSLDIDNAYTATLVRAALDRNPLPHY